MRRRLGKVARDASGATAVEYGLILALIALAALGGLAAIADGSNANWRKTTEKTSQAMAQTAP